MMKINKVYNEDCLETLRKMPDDFIDLVVTSPPYDNLRDYKGYTFEFEAIAKELFRVMKIGGCVVWVVGDATIDGSETGTSFRQALFFKDIGFNLNDTMLYQKLNPSPNETGPRYQACFEYMFCFSKGKPKTFNPIMVKAQEFGKRKPGKHATFTEKNGLRRKASSICGIRAKKFHYNIFGYFRYIQEKHPATFPLDLAIDQIKTWSNPGDLVYDPFMGSGKVAVACLQYQRNFIGSEISAEYCVDIEKVIRKEKQNPGFKLLK